MDALMAAAGLVTVAALTPGSNNLVVMRAAARAGAAGALPAVAGVVLGGLALLALVAAGGGALFRVVPHARSAVTLVGTAYLSWLGVQLVLARQAEEPSQQPVGTPATSVAALFGFQFLNPKSWVMATAAVSASQADGALAAFLRLALLFTLIPTLCLLLWAGLGSLLTRALLDARRRARVDRVMGTLLLASALLLLLQEA